MVLVSVDRVDILDQNFLLRMRYVWARKGLSGKTVTKITASTNQWLPTLATVIPPRKYTPLLKSSAVVTIDGLQVIALFDSGRSKSFIHPSVIKEASHSVQPFSSTVLMATSELVTNAVGYCRVYQEYQKGTDWGASFMSKEVRPCVLN